MSDRRRRPLPKSASEPEGLWAWAERYLLWMKTRNFAGTTVTGRRSFLRLFVEWCEVRGLSEPGDISKPILETYQRHLFYQRKPSGKPLGFRSQAQHLVSLRGYFKWLTQQNVILSNPASELELPRKGVRLPREVLSEPEVEAVLRQPDVSDPLGIRDRAILEVLYSTGVRRKELCELGLYDIEESRGTAFVRQGKWGKDRVVPIGERALFWVRKYVRSVRPSLIVLQDAGPLFLTRWGEGFSPGALSRLVREYIESADIGKTGSCHIFRHTMATLMLEGGADVRHIQEILGHSDLSSTQIYTHVSIRRLSEVHARTHPGARMPASQKGPGVAKARASRDPSPADILEQLDKERADEDQLSERDYEAPDGAG